MFDDAAKQMQAWLIHEIVRELFSVLNEIVADAIDGRQVTACEAQCLGHEHDAAVPEAQFAEVQWEDTVKVLAQNESLAQLAVEREILGL